MLHSMLQHTSDFSPTSASSIHNTGADALSNESSRLPIIYHHVRRRVPHTVKPPHSSPSRFMNLPNQFELCRWGSTFQLSLSPEDVATGDAELQAIRNKKVLGQFTACALSGNDLLGSVFYALPAVVAVGGVFTPISLSVATLILFLWRPIMEELASAFPIDGGPYTYLLNVSSKQLALVSAALLMLDFVSTSVESAATASAYLAGEIELPFPEWVGTVIVLLLLVCVSLTGIRDSARLALSILSFHLLTMGILVITAAVHWGRIGNTRLKENWHAGLELGGTSSSQIFKQFYYGFSLAVLGLTGFECTPSYIAHIEDKQFPNVLRNLHLPAIVLNSVIMLLVLAIVPFDVVLSGDNMLSVLGLMTAGRWLRILVVIDAFIVLCGGVLAGILSACELLCRLAQDRVIPTLFLKSLPTTGAPFLSILIVTVVCVVLSVSTRELDVVSQMHSLVWLTVMALFPLCLLLLKYNRGHIKRSRRTPLFVIFCALLICVVAISGNFAVNSRTLEYFAAYFIGITIFFSLPHIRISILCLLYWTIDQHPSLHKWKITCEWSGWLADAIRQLKQQPICILVKSDEPINQLFHMASYVSKNEETSCIKVVHFYDEEKGVPSELEANCRLLDEAFPTMTIDLVLISGAFEPRTIAALSRKFGVPTSLMFMKCPGSNFGHSLAELGTRIISF